MDQADGSDEEANNFTSVRMNETFLEVGEN
jgi:hypothetical protein